MGKTRLFLATAAVLFAAAGAAGADKPEKGLHGNAPPEARAEWQKAMDLIKDEKAKKDFEAQIKALERAIAIHPKYALAYYSLGCVQIAKGDQTIDGRAYEAAVESFKKAVELGAEWAGLYNNLATAYRKLGDLDEALAQLAVARRKSPRSVTVLNNIAEIYFSKEDPKSARKVLNEALSYDPTNSRTQRNIRRLYEVRQ